MSTDDGYTFMTGATGFLGNYLLRDLLRQGRRVTAMVREPVDESQARLAAGLKGVGVDIGEYLKVGTLQLVGGALPDSLPALSSKPHDILSCAASLQLFTNGNDEPFKTNVMGTKRLMEWAQAHGVRRIHAVSTAYVCGSYTESVKEVFHTPEPEFKTQYERSKWLAEGQFLDWAKQAGHTLTIYRPSFLVGDSQTGYTTQFGGFYQFARMLSILKQEYGRNGNGSPTHIPLRIPGGPDDPQNFVPIDFASRIIAEVMQDESLHGRIYHLTDPSPRTNGEIKAYLEAYFDMHGGYFADPAAITGHCTPAESLLWEQFEPAAPQVTHNPRFCQRNTGQVMDSAGIVFPEMDQRRFAMLLDYAIDNHWGQRRGRNRSRNGNQCSEVAS